MNKGARMTPPTNAGPIVVHTVGHSNRTREELQKLLASSGIEVVFDVRSAPWSRRFPQHAKHELDRALEEVGIEYRWLGLELGGLRDEGYAAHQETEEYASGLGRVLKLAETQSVALLCAEREPAHCHRRFIADDLSARGVIVRHLVDEGLVLPHQMRLI
jgi:uncharacterized protein (DUF488 family)